MSAASATDNDKKAIKFVDYIFKRCKEDKGFRARMRRAGNPATEYQSWDTLASFVDLEKQYERRPFAIIAAAIANDKHEANGQLKLGQAINNAYDQESSKKSSNDKGDNNGPATVRLRRLLACDNTEEVCMVLRPLLSLIQSRASQPLDYASLLYDLQWFYCNHERIKTRWAKQFYNRKTDAGAGKGS